MKCILYFAIKIGMCSFFLPPATQLLFIWGYLILHYCLIMCLFKNTRTQQPQCDQNVRPQRVLKPVIRGFIFHHVMTGLSVPLNCTLSKQNKTAWLAQYVFPCIFPFILFWQTFAKESPLKGPISSQKFDMTEHNPWSKSWSASKQCHL